MATTATPGSVSPELDSTYTGGEEPTSEGEESSSSVESRPSRPGSAPPTSDLDNHMFFAMQHDMFTQSGAGPEWDEGRNGIADRDGGQLDGGIEGQNGGPGGQRERAAESFTSSASDIRKNGLVADDYALQFLTTASPGTVMRALGETKDGTAVVSPGTGYRRLGGTRGGGGQQQPRRVERGRARPRLAPPRARSHALSRAPTRSHALSRALARSRALSCALTRHPFAANSGSSGSTAFGDGRVLRG